MPTSSLLQKVALVTGASRGIGAAIARRLAQDGARVVINYASSAEHAERLCEEIRGVGGDAMAIRADVSKAAEVKRLFDESIAACGKLDILVNNAGIAIFKPVVDFSEDEFDRLLGINVKGTFYACQEAARRLADGGRIINLSTSVVGVMLPNYVAYAATKGAVEQITRQLAKEVGKRGITVNAVAPGPTDTELFSEGKSEEDKARFGQMASLGRLGQPSDIADVVAFLASHDGRWVSGQTLRVNGGFI